MFARLIGRSDETRHRSGEQLQVLRVTSRDNGCTQRRTRVTGMLPPLRPKLFVELHMGGIGGLFRQESSIVDDEKKLPFASIALNGIAFQQSWWITPPKTGIGFPAEVYSHLLCEGFLPMASDSRCAVTFSRDAFLLGWPKPPGKSTP
jgi:hypothetical protein